MNCTNTYIFSSF